MLLFIFYTVPPPYQRAGNLDIVILHIITQLSFVPNCCFANNLLRFYFLCGEVGGNENIPVSMPYLVRQKADVPGIRQVTCWLGYCRKVCRKWVRNACPLQFVLCHSAVS